MGDIGELSPDLLEEWPVYRIVLAKIATLKEIEENWCYTDILKMNAYLDMQDDYEQAFNEMDMHEMEKNKEG